MTTFNIKHKKCEGCICYILDDPSIFITDTIFHNNICRLHFMHVNNKKNNIEKEQYEKTGRNVQKVSICAFLNITFYNKT